MIANILFALCLSAVGFAQPVCTPQAIARAEQSALNMQFATLNTRGNSIVEELAAFRQACGSTPDVELIVAYAFLKRAEISGSSPEQQLGDINQAWQALTRISEQQGFPAQTQVHLDVSQSVMIHIMRLSDQSELSLPEFVANEPLTVCPDYAGNMAQSLWYSYKETWAGYAPAYITKLAQSCSIDTGTRLGHPVFWQALMLSGLAAKSSDPIQALAYSRDAYRALDIWYSPEAMLPGFERDGVQGILKTRARLELAAGTDPVTAFELEPSTEMHMTYARYLIAYGAAALWDGSVRAANPDQVDLFKEQVKAVDAYIKSLDQIAKAKGTAAQAILFDGMTDFAMGAFNPETDPPFLAPPDILWRETKP